MSESLEGIGGLIEVSTVAEQLRPVMAELHMPVENLRVGILVLVVGEHVGMYKIYTFVLRLCCPSSCFPLFLWRSHCERQSHDEGYNNK